MTRVFRIALLSGVLVSAGLAFPSIAEAQRGGGGGGRGGGAVARGGTARGGGAVVRGGGVYGGNNVAVPRRYPPYSSPYYRSYYSRGYYSHPYYYRPYYYRPYYAGYYPYYYSPWSFSLSFGWYGAGWYPPSLAYPYYYYPYPSAYSAYPAPTGSQPAYDTMVSTGRPDNSQRDEGAATARTDYAGDFGTLSIRVVPSDATIVIDHHAWDGPRGDERFSVELGAGPHQVEIRKAGYATYVRTIDVPRGRPMVLNVALTPAGTGTPQVARTVPLRH